MARISGYAPDTDVTKLDKIIGTDSSGTTKNFRIEDVSNYFKNSNSSGIAGQFTWQYKVNAVNNIGDDGMMNITTSEGTSLANITSIKVSKCIYENSPNSIADALPVLNDKDVLIVDVSNHNNWGIYTAGTVAVDGSDSNFYNLSLTYLNEGNGNLSENVVYGIAVLKQTVGTAPKVTVTDSNTDTAFPIVFHDESNSLLDDTGKFTYNPNDGILSIPEIYNTTLTLGRDAHNKIYFVTDNEIGFAVDFTTHTTMKVGKITPGASNSIAIGDSSLTYKELYLHGGNITSPSSSQLDFTTTTANFSGSLRLDSVSISAVQTASESFVDNDTSIMTSAAIDDRINAATPTTITVAANNSSDETVYPIFVDGATGAQDAETDTGLTYNPSSGLLTTAGLDISGDIDVDGTTNLDAVDIDGAVQIDGDVTIGVATEGGGGNYSFKVEGKNEDAEMEWVGGSTFPSGMLRFSDGAKISMGHLGSTIGDLDIYHDGSGAGYVSNSTGSLTIQGASGDNDVLFRAANGAGAGIITYFTMDGGEATHDGSATTAMYTIFHDLSRAAFGDGKDLQIYHDGSNSYISESGTGGLVLDASGISGTAIKDEDNMSSDSASHLASQQSIKAYVDAGAGYTAEKIQDVVGAMFSGNTETNITATYQDADGTIDLVATGTAYTAGNGLTLNTAEFDLDAALTTVTSILNTSLVTGRDADNQIKYSTDDQIIFRVAGGDGVIMKASGEIEATKFDGALEGNADTATALASGRTIGMTGDVVWTSASFDGSGNVTGTSAIQADAVHATMVNDDIISGQTELVSADVAAEDELLISDGGTIKKVGVDSLKTYIDTNTDVDVSNANLLTRLAALESSGGSGDENITIGTDSGDTIVITGNLQVSGTTTTVNSTTVNLNDHNIVLDSGNSTSAVIDGAGITLEGGSGTDATFTYSTTGPKFEMKLGSDYEDLQVSKLIADELDIDGVINVGVDDTGYDVKFFGATSGRYLLWDESDDSLNLADNTKLKIGTSGDLELYHDASNSYIVDGGTGDLIIQSTNLKLRVNNTEDAILCDANAGVTLYYDGGARISATNAGATVTGALTVTTDADIDGTLEADAYTVDGTALNEYIADTVGAMFTSNTETNITATYQDGDNTIDLVVATGAGAALNDLSDTLIENDSLWVGNDPSSTTNNAQRNTAVGPTALQSITTGDDNTAMGRWCGADLTTGSNNSFFGANAGGNVTTGSNNVAIGYNSLFALSTIGQYNVVIGSEAGNDLTYSTGDEAQNNTFVGGYAGNVVNSSGGADMTTGYQNTFIGMGATGSAAGGINQTAIGYLAVGGGDNTVVLGNSSVTAWLPPDDNGVDLGSSGKSFKDAHIQGTLNVGAIAASGALTIGVDDTGYDVKFFGATSGKYMLWDESDDALEFTDDTKIKLGTGGDGEIYSSSDDLIIANVTSDKDIIFKGNDGGSTITALTLDMSNEGTAKFAKGISTGDTSGGNSGPLTLAGGMTQTFTGSGATTTFNTHTNSTTASGSTDASAFLISQKNTSGSAIEYRQGVIADGNAFFGAWGSGSITGMGLNISTGNVTFSNNIDVDGTANLDAVDIDGAVQLDGTFTVGVDDTGHDVKLFGATSGKYLLWDESDDSLNITDDTKLQIGTSQELQIYHTGSGNSIISETGSGNLFIDATNFRVRNSTAGGESMIHADADGAVELYHDNSKKFETTSAGATVTGALTVTTDIDVDGTTNLDAVDIDGNVQLDGTLTVGVDDTGYDVKLFGATSGRYLLWDESDDALEFNDSVKATFGTGADLVLQHDGNNSYIDANGTGDLIIEQMTADKDIILKCDDGSGGETAYITLDGSTSKVTVGRDSDFAGDVDVTGSVKVTQNLRRTVTAVTHSTNTFTCTLTANDNFSFTLNNATNTINIVAASENVGQSGTIIATNPSSVGSFAVNAIQGNADAAEVLTPEGATINWPSTANSVSMLSYYVAAADKILINFIGNFTN